VVADPLTASQIVSRTFALYRARFGHFLLVAAVFVLPATSVGRLVGPTDSLLSYLPTALQDLAALVISCLAVAALQGRRATLGDTFGEAWRRIVPYIGVSLVQGAAALLIVGPGYALLRSLLGIQSDAVTDMPALFTHASPALYVAAGAAVLLLAVGMPLGIYLALRWSVTTPAILVDRAGVAGTFGRSWDLTRGQASHCLATWLLAGLIMIAASTVVSMIGKPLGATPELLLNTAASIFLLPLAVIANVILYFDLAARKRALGSSANRPQGASAAANG
jgi:hypothetical protein